MGEYLLDIPAIATQMVGADVVLGIQWLQSFRAMVINFQEIFVRFSLELERNMNLEVSKGYPLK
jgi:hypothetical protein